MPESRPPGNAKASNELWKSEQAALCAAPWGCSRCRSLPISSKSKPQSSSIFGYQLFHVSAIARLSTSSSHICVQSLRCEPASVARTTTRPALASEFRSTVGANRGGKRSKLRVLGAACSPRLCGRIAGGNERIPPGPARARRRSRPKPARNWRRRPRPRHCRPSHECWHTLRINPETALPAIRPGPARLWQRLARVSATARSRLVRYLPGQILREHLRPTPTSRLDSVALGRAIRGSQAT